MGVLFICPFSIVVYELTLMYVLGDIKSTHSYYKDRFFLNLSMW